MVHPSWKLEQTFGIAAWEIIPIKQLLKQLNLYPVG